MTLSSDLAAIRARCEAATPGPWSALNDTLVRGPRGESVAVTLWTNHVANARLIAHAREDLPRLLIRLEEMREALEEIKDSAETSLALCCRENVGGKRTTPCEQCIKNPCDHWYAVWKYANAVLRSVEEPT